MYACSLHIVQTTETWRFVYASTSQHIDNEIRFFHVGDETPARLFHFDFSINHSSFLRKIFCVPCPIGWTQVNNIALFWLKIKVDIRATVDIAKAVFFQHFVV